MIQDTNGTDGSLVLGGGQGHFPYRKWPGSFYIGKCIQCVRYLDVASVHHQLRIFYYMSNTNLHLEKCNVELGMFSKWSPTLAWSYLQNQVQQKRTRIVKTVSLSRAW